MIEERSAGAVLFHDLGDMLEYLILQYPAGHWEFPKGNVELGEGEEDTVIREINEETGIKAVTLKEGFKKNIEYYYRREGTLVHKQVAYYLVQAASRKVKLSREHTGYNWLTFDKALKRLTYRNAKSTLQSAHKFLQESNVKSCLTDFSSP